MSKLTNEQAHRIAGLAIEINRADRVLFQQQGTSAYRAARETRSRVDQLRADLADAIADVEK